MRLLALGCCVALVVSCARSEQDTATDTAAGTAAPATSTISLNDVAGRWNVVSTPESSTDTVVTRYTLTATADTTGWMISFPNREPVPLRIVAVAGDSIIGEAGPFESVRRKGVQVTTRNTFRLQGGRLVGSTLARYASRDADTVRTFRTDGTRAP